MRLRLLVLCFITTTVLATSGGWARAQTTVPGETTTAAPSTTEAPTTTAPTTTPTTLAPTTTVAPSTTTAPTTPTTLAPASSSGSSSSSTPWIILIVVLVVLAIILVIVLWRMVRSRRRVESAWRADAARTYDNAVLVRSMLDDEARPGEAEDPTFRATVRDRVEGVAASLDRLAANAPDDSARQTAANAAESLRGVAFAREAERLLRAAPTAPTGDQLARADQTRRARADELDAALAALRERAHVDEQRD